MVFSNVADGSEWRFRTSRRARPILSLRLRCGGIRRATGAVPLRGSHPAFPFSSGRLRLRPDVFCASAVPCAGGRRALRHAHAAATFFGFVCGTFRKAHGKSYKAHRNLYIALRIFYIVPEFFYNAMPARWPGTWGAIYLFFLKKRRG